MAWLGRRDLCYLPVPKYWRLQHNISGKIKYPELIKVAFNLENERRLRLLAVGKCQQIIGEDYGKKKFISKKNIFIVRQQ